VLPVSMSGSARAVEPLKIPICRFFCRILASCLGRVSQQAHPFAVAVKWFGLRRSLSSPVEPEVAVEQTCQEMRQSCALSGSAARLATIGRVITLASFPATEIPEAEARVYPGRH
jgi:hypothetical protein